MIKKYQWSPILGWSISRSQRFYQCKRNYFYQYCRKHVQSCSVEKVEALRALTSVSLEVGKIVHDSIASVISGPVKHGHTQSIKPDALVDRYVSLMRKAAKSKDFIEDYYPQYPKDKDNDIERGLDKIKDSIIQFFDSHWYEWLKDCPNHLRKKWIIEPKDYGECRIDDLKAYCKVDFIFPDGKNGYNILDWKTGRIDELKHKTQMLGYIFYAIDQFPVPAEKVNPIVVYLGSEYKELTIPTERDMESFKAKVKRETEDMYQYCVNIDENIPLDEDKFERTSNRKCCPYCKFQELCDDK